MGLLRDVAVVRRRARGRQRAVLPRVRPGARARAGPLPDALRGPLARGAGGGERAAARGRAPARAPAAHAPTPTPRRQRVRALPARRPERRRRLGRRAGPVVVAALHRLDGARPRRRRPQPAPTSARSRYMRAHASQLNDLGELTRTILVLRAAGQPPKLGGRDLEHAVVSQQRKNGSFGGRVNTTAFAILGLRASGRSTHDRAIRRAAAFIAAQRQQRRRLQLRRPRRPVGDRRHRRGAPGARRRRPQARHDRQAGRELRRPPPGLRRRLRADPGRPVECAVDRLGGPGPARRRAATRAKVHRNGARDPMAYLRSLTTASGEVRYSRTSRQTPVWVTGQALAALSRKPLPLKPVNACAPRDGRCRTGRHGDPDGDPEAGQGAVAAAGRDAPRRNPRPRSRPSRRSRPPARW